MPGLVDAVVPGRPDLAELMAGGGYHEPLALAERLRIGTGPQRLSGSDSATAPCCAHRFA